MVIKKPLARIILKRRSGVFKEGKMHAISAFFDLINEYLVGAFVPITLLLAGSGYLFYLRAFHIRHPLLLLRSMLKPQKKAEREGISPFRAVTLALAGTLGVGNLVGVASAITFGGAGAVFWMLVSAFVAMLLKYAEIVLAVRYRELRCGGARRGGAMYYIRVLFRRIGLPRLGAVIAGIFALFCILDSLTMGCVIQMNAVGTAFRGVFGLSPILTGAVLAVVVFLITLGGGKRISALTERLVPFMTLLYLVLSIAVLVLRREALGSAFRAVVEDAFSFRSAGAGIGGFLFSKAIRLGTMRGLMSNEAGCGTAPIAHAESSAEYPAEQGVWGIFEVFADTILLCTLTAAVLLVSYDRVALYGADSMMMTVKAYSTVLGVWSEPILALLVLFFAFATVICWAHYGRSALSYFTERKSVHIVYLILLSLSTFYGANAAPASIWTAADFAIGVMTLLNVGVIFAMRREVREETDRFLSLFKRKKIE